MDIGSGSGVIYLDDFDLVEMQAEEETSSNLRFVKSDQIEESNSSNLRMLLPLAGGIASLGIMASIVILILSKKNKLL